MEQKLSRRASAMVGDDIAAWLRNTPVELFSGVFPELVARYDLKVSGVSDLDIRRRRGVVCGRLSGTILGGFLSISHLRRRFRSSVSHLRASNCFSRAFSCAGQLGILDGVQPGERHPLAPA
ncbi:hypothetical protein [Amycolatopsis deserti]|uniref:hypothetical protein n=1 Tax=Amycolatopsis deserti TaxID=185696 RepID=UPI00174D264D|nr:hypothetical protein [Amycolatopsis deserti]